MKSKNILFLILLAIGFNAYSQESQPQKISHDIFVGGIKVFAQVMRKNLKYPPRSKRNDIQGIAIVQVTVKTDGQFTANYMTRLDDDVEEIISKAISKSVPVWRANEEDYTKYLAIAFNSGKYDYEELSESISEMPKNLGTPFLGLMQVYSPGSSSRNRAFKYYENLKKKATQYIEIEQFQSAYEKLNEAIRFNPFNVQDIMLRQEMEQKLGLNTYRPYDLAWARALPRVVAQMKKE